MKACVKVHVADTISAKASEIATRETDKEVNETYVNSGQFINYYDCWKNNYNQILKELSS